MTVQEFLALPESQGERRELIGGEIVSMGQGGRPHEFVKSNVNRLLLAWFLQNRPSRVLIETGFQVDEQNFLIPDLSYVSKNSGERPAISDRFKALPIWPSKSSPPSPHRN